MTTSNQHDRDIPVLTDIIDGQESSHEEEHAPPRMPRYWLKSRKK